MRTMTCFPCSILRFESLVLGCSTDTDTRFAPNENPDETKEFYLCDPRVDPKPELKIQAAEDPAGVFAAQVDLSRSFFKGESPTGLFKMDQS